MKRLTALAALLLVAAAAGCTTTTDNTNTGAGNANLNANATPAATATPVAGPTQADIEAKERQVWDAIKAKNWDAFAANLADDFIIVSERGVETKAQTVDSIKKYDLSEYTFSDIRFIKVDADLAVLIYTSTEKSTYDGKPNSGKPLHNGSAWVNRGGKWLAVYHQESEAREMPSGQGGNSNANASAANANASHANMNANTSASPASSPAAPATVIDTEKAVWDAIKSKNTDAFTNFLSADAIEVEPEGVMDRAGSVKGVMAFDASKYVLSDFKETKLDTDATLVTYKVKGPDEKGHMTEMYHSTIWTNHSGQWKAAFHQGTYASKGNAM
ncbi:MAG: hypothetical protein QOE46_2987 [Acidobacteriota bacterium]|jgi:hypothetical protein|nr:hypothetical protein [Acidobacteriota bacterium]